MVRRSTARRPDGVLVMAARAGSAPAFDELYRSHAPRVAQKVRGRVGRDEHLVADIVQEVFTRALENLDRLRDPARFGAWIGAIADHVVVDHYRAAARSRPLDDHTAEEIVSTDASADSVAEAGEMARLLRRSVAGLSARDAAAITLVSTLGLSPAELGAVLGVSRGAAKVLLHRARTRLKVALRLQVLLEHRSSRCEELWRLVEDGATTTAARHVQGCARCTDADGRLAMTPVACSA